MRTRCGIRIIPECPGPVGCAFLAVLITAAVPARVDAGGRAEDFAFVPVSGKSHWNYTIDLEQLEEGKHNLVIRSVDEAGNIRLEGPYDIHVDPETDIPVVAVAHPRPGSRVGRMLPIIGTARDDDGVSRVEVKINDGPWRPASGTAAWSAILDAGSLGDGPQIMFVKSVDLNSLESAVMEVPFIVDTSAPVGGVTEPVSGAVISGKTVFTGTIEDPNGIRSLDISRDGGAGWESLKFARDRDTGAAAFQVNLDTRDLEDGPVVWWFRGTDTQGTLSEIPFLFFVDNRGPEVTLELPAEGEEGFGPFPGDVFLAGTVADLSGVRSISILAGKGDPVEVPVTPGNPWWTWPLNLSGIGDKQVDVVISASDGAGNTSTLKYRLPLDTEADRPKINLDDTALLATDVFISGTGFLTGQFHDDDGGGTIAWSAGAAEGVLESVERVWRLELPELPVGTAEIQLTPVDRHGLEGETYKFTVRTAPEKPLISLHSALDSRTGSTVDWEPGMVFSSSGGSILGSIRSDAGRSLKLTYIPTGGEEVVLALKTDPSDSGRLTFTIPVRKNEAPGSRNFILRAADGFGGASVLGSGFYVQAPAGESGDAPDPRLDDERINVPLPFLRETDGAAILRTGQPLQGWTNGISTSGARLEPESPFLKLLTRGTSFTIENAAPGLSEPVKVVLADGTSSRPFVVLTDDRGPRWELDEPASGFFSAGTLRLEGTVADDGGLRAVSWRLKDSPANPIPFEQRAEGRYSIDTEIDVSGMPDGPKVLILLAEDTAGNTSEHHLPFVLDTTVPLVEPVLPPAGQPVGALSTLVYRVIGDEMVDQFSVTVDGDHRRYADHYSYYALDIGLAGYTEVPETLRIQVTDRAGNTAEITPRLLYDPVSDKPITSIQTPVDMSVVRGPTDIAGLVADDDAIETVLWRLDGGSWNTLSGDASFRSALPLESLEDGSHLLEVYARDTAGNVGEPDAAWFEVTREEPEVTLLSPVVGTYSSGVTEVTGTSQDANGIAEVWVSFDNGHTYALAEGATEFVYPWETGREAVTLPESQTAGSLTESPGGAGEPPADAATVSNPTVTGPIIRSNPVNWRYALDTGLLDDGTHTLLVRVVDGAGDEALLAGLLNVDNRPPVLAVGDPVEGSLQSGSMMLEGRAADDGGLKNFRATIERDGTVLREYQGIPEGVFHIPFDFADLATGEVLLRVEAVDNAGNTTTVSRSFHLEPGRRAVRGVVSLPVEGSDEGPFFRLTGYVDNALAGDVAYLLIDGIETAELELDGYNRFRREFTPDDLADGSHTFRIDVMTADGGRTEGDQRSFHYRSSGTWIVVDGFEPGQAVGNRPLITGRTGYHLTAPSEEDRDAWKDYQATMKENRVQRIEVSIDGGLSFARADGRGEWEFRIETDRIGDGDLPVLVRALYPDGWVHTRTLLRLDKTLPDLKLNESVADGRYNEVLVLSGTSSDDRRLDEVSVSVRPGGQNRYEVPSFVQGMYFDVAALGATWFSAGLGFTFFEDNVKLQISAGYSPEEVKDNGQFAVARVYGSSVGATLLANILYLPLGYYWGHGWDRLSVSLAIGANFTYFSHFADSGGGVISSVVIQTELPKISFPDRRFLTYLAPYLEGRVWFFSSDVSTDPYFTASIGLRMGLF